jgi:hypothetical protein
MEPLDWIKTASDISPPSTYPRYMLVVEDGVSRVEKIKDIVQDTAAILEYGDRSAYVSKDFEP